MSQKKISPERLAQLARRKLAALGVETRLVGEPGLARLEGTLDLVEGALRHPLHGASITRATFTVIGHDRLQFLKPAILADLGPVPFFDYAELGQLVAQVNRLLQQQAAAARLLGQRLQALGLAAQDSGEQLRLRVVLQLPGLGKLWLEQRDQQLQVVARQGTGESRATAVQPVTLDPGDYQDRADLELELSQLFEQLQPLSAARPAEPAPPPPPASPQVAGVPLGELLQRLGGDCLVANGAVLAKDLLAGDRHLRLALRLEGEQVSLRLLEKDAVIWSGRHDLARITSAEDLVATIAGEPTVAAAAPVTPRPSTVEPAAPQAVPVALGEPGGGQALPVAGEVWVMNVLVERDDGNEIRYVGIDADGQPFGAQRVLQKEIFERVFTRLSSGVYRLPVQVVQVAGGKVCYHQLDAQRRPLAEQRFCDVAAFMSNFVPEAAAF